MPKLVTLNVGLPQDVSWRGRTVHTECEDGRVRSAQVRRLNIDGTQPG